MKFALIRGIGIECSNNKAIRGVKSDFCKNSMIPYEHKMSLGKLPLVTNNVCTSLFVQGSLGGEVNLYIVNQGIIM